MIKVSKLDEVYLSLEAEFSSIDFESDVKNLERIDSYFSAYAENYQHNYEFLSGKWDGMIRFLRKIKYGVYIFPIGLLNNLINFTDINGIELNIQFDVNDIYCNKDVDWNKLKPILNTPEHFEDRDYQKQYVDEFFKTGRGCILSPTGSGKSAIIYMIIKNLLSFQLQSTEKILIVVPTVDLIIQLYDEFIENGFENIDDYVYMLSAGIPKLFEKQITISTWQSLQNMPPETFSQFSVLIVDECHGVSSTAEKLSYISHWCINARYRLGTTGTTPDKKLDELTMVSYLGPLLKLVTTKDLIKRGYLTTLTIKSIILNWKRKGGFDIEDFQKEYDAIVECKERMNVLLELCVTLYRQNPETSIIVLGRRVEHLREIYNLITEFDPSINAYLVTGKDTKKKTRHDIYNTLRNSGGIFFATEKIAGTGLNIKNISKVILSTPLKSKVTILQAIGRGVRKHDKKNNLEVYDLIDKIPLQNKKVNSSYKWVQKKENIYANECFTNKFYVLELPINS